MANQAVTPVGLNHLVLNVRDIEESHRFWTETIGFKQVGEIHATPKRPNPPKMRFYSGDHGDGALSHHDIALIENTNLPAPPAEWSMSGAAVRDQPHRHRAAEPRGMAEAARVSAGARRKIRSPRRAWHDAQPVHPRSERLRRRTAVRVAARGMGRRHRRRAELRRAGADRRPGSAGGPHGERAGVQGHAIRQTPEVTMAKRQSVNGSRARHENPIPNASRIGNIVMSSVIGGTNPGHARAAADAGAAGRQRVRLHPRTTSRPPAARVDDIIKITSG